MTFTTITARTALCAALIALASSGAAPLPAAASSYPHLTPPLQPGLIILARHRFDPAVQRLIAERSLQALPLRDGQLYYLYPLGGRGRLDGQLEEMQIRYLEQLLEKRALAEPDSESQ